MFCLILLVTKVQRVTWISISFSFPCFVYISLFNYGTAIIVKHYCHILIMSDLMFDSLSVIIYKCVFSYKECIIHRKVNAAVMQLTQ